ncbi:MAG: hypothetical protein HOH79_04935 [Euryarchaeota archaeon]|jgi:hypothetical protein|nr:hypothetical protein [Euryarchaeota archaeon]
MTGQISEDGMYMWDGTNWVANPNAPATQGMATDISPQMVVENSGTTTPPVAQQPMMQAATPEGVYGSGTWKIQMADSGLGMFFLKIACLLINMFTLFLAVPFTSVMYYNAWASKVDIDGRSLKFTGNAGGFLVTWIKTLLLSAITFGIYYILIGRKNVMRWVDSNLTWA